MSDGSHDGEPGDGAGFGGGGDGDDVNADAIEQELRREANVQLHATAQAVVSILEAHMSRGDGTQQLSKEDKETINFVVPLDLTPYEVEAIQHRLSDVGVGTRQDLVTTVVEAMQQLRPFGQQKLGPPKEPPKQSPVEQAKQASDRSPAVNAAIKRRRTPRKNKSLKTIPVKSIVSPDETLSRVIRIDESGTAYVPPVVSFRGFDARVELTAIALHSYDTGDPTTEASFKVKVRITPIKPPPGLRYVGGVPIQDGVATESVTVVSVSRPRAGSTSAR